MTIAPEAERAAAKELLAGARRRLLAERVPAGHWVGDLSSSALSTATAAFALHLFGNSGFAAGRSEEAARLAAGGVRWLAANQNDDVGWGDTTRSLSNISTTALCWAALRAVPGSTTDALKRAESWLTRAAGALEPHRLSHAISSRYGKDRTFSVPILTMCAAAGALGDDGWRHVPQLPFELAVAPRSLFALLRLPVVSYALPALIAIGQVRHRRRPSRNPVSRLARSLAAPRTLRILEAIQPRGGGFLEATPLTAFVVMSLVAADRGGGAVVSRGVDFLRASVRPDGSWPIDTNLATWVTTLSVNALADTGLLDDSLSADDRDRIARWLLRQQYREIHPYTGAAPGGWSWTDLPGGVPDADDTAGVLLALRNLGVAGSEVVEAAGGGLRWLLGLQNRDGGIPTFCRGWGTLPFDRSTPELTAHALQAWAAWRDRVGVPLAEAIDRAAARAIAYLQKSQRPDGAWVPLWFGNQLAHDEENPTYGTARVLTALTGAKWSVAAGGGIGPMVDRGVAWLLAAQTADGGWGGAAGVTPSVEETCQALRAVAAVRHWRRSSPGATVRSTGELDAASSRGQAFLTSLADTVDGLHPAPIGLYFAKLWYWERLYPLIGMTSLDATLPG